MGGEDEGERRLGLTRYFAGCHSYSVPEEVREHIDLIKPTVHFLHRVPTPDQLQKRSFERPSTHIKTMPKTDGSLADVPPNLANCDQLITLDCLRALYSIDYTPVSTDKNTFGICECSRSVQCDVRRRVLIPF